MSPALLGGLFLFAACAPSAPLAQDSAPQSFSDPAPPEVQGLKQAGPSSPMEHEGWSFHAEPKPLADGAVVEDSPGFMGPRRDGRSMERPLLAEWPEGGPNCVWEMECGEGYAAPAAVGGRLVFSHRVGAQVHIDCLEAETGKRWWRHSYASDYRGEYISDRGPRATPCIAGDRVLVHGVEGVLHCLDAATGERLALVLAEGAEGTSLVGMAQELAARIFPKAARK